MIKLLFIMAILTMQGPGVQISPGSGPGGVQIYQDAGDAQFPENRISYIHNTTNRTVSARYKVIIGSNPPRQYERGPIRLQPGQRERIGGSCAYDVTYSSMCGSPVGYQLLSWEPV
jgi:hypothetical protein